MDLYNSSIQKSSSCGETELKKRALSILRISDNVQKSGYGIESQWEDDILTNAPQLGLEVSEELRRVVVERATDWHRSKFAETVGEAIELYKQGKIEAVVFPRVDRESRFVFSSMPLLSAMLQTGVEVYFARELLYLNPRDHEAVSRYLEKVGQSQAYIETMRVNTMRGRRQRAKGKPEEGIPGKLPTGGVNLYGYIYHKSTGKRFVNDYEAGIIRIIIDLLLRDHLSLKEICRRLVAKGIPAPRGGQIWSPSTVSRILRNRVYTGITYACTMDAIEPKTRKKTGSYAKSARKLRHKDEWVLLPDDTTPGIITPSEFKLIQKRLLRNQELSPRNQKYEYLLRNFVYCQKCRNKYYGVPQHGKRYYRCSRRSSNLILGDPCRNRSVNADELENQVWQSIVKNVCDPDIALEAQQDHTADVQLKEWYKEIDALNSKLTMLDKAETRLIRLFSVTTITEAKLRSEISQIQAQQREAKNQIKEFETSIEEYQKFEPTKEQIRDLLIFVREIYLQADLEDTAGFRLKRSILEKLGLKVWIVEDGSFWLDFTVSAIPPRDYHIVSTRS